MIPEGLQKKLHPHALDILKSTLAGAAIGGIMGGVTKGLSLLGVHNPAQQFPPGAVPNPPPRSSYQYQTRTNWAEGMQQQRHYTGHRHYGR